MYTIGNLIKQFNLSRSTLLYYDKIGLLKASSRSKAGYRLYSQEAVIRMSTIAMYKEAGLSLEAITKILDSPNNHFTELLQQKLESLNAEMSRIRQQQRLVLQLLGTDSLLTKAKVINKSQWVKILRASGMDEGDMHQWHAEFERRFPEAHSDFLESLGMAQEEIAHVKASAAKLLK